MSKTRGLGNSQENPLSKRNPLFKTTHYFNEGPVERIGSYNSVHAGGACQWVISGGLTLTPGGEGSTKSLS